VCRRSAHVDDFDISSCAPLKSSATSHDDRYRFSLNVVQADSGGGGGGGRCRALRSTDDDDDVGIEF